LIDQNKFGIYFELTLSILFIYTLELKHENVEDEAGDDDEEDAEDKEDAEDGEDEEDDNKKIGGKVSFIIDSEEN
jgi:hypothetical protein